MNWNWNKFVIGLLIGMVVGPLIVNLLYWLYDWLTRGVDAYRRNAAKFK